MNPKEPSLQHHQWAGLIEFAGLLGRQDDFQEILHLVAHKSAQWLKADLALVLLINPETRDTVKTVVRDGKQVTPETYRQIHIHVGGWIIKHGEPFLSNNLQKDERFLEDLFKKVPIKSVLGAPLLLQGSIIGVILLLFKNPAENFLHSTFFI